MDVVTPRESHAEPSAVRASGLRTAAVSGVKWTGVSAAVTFVFQLVQASVVAHFVAPRDYGLVTIVVLVTGLAAVFSDLGISGALIARRIDDRETLSSLFWTNVVVGVVIAALIVATAPAVAAAYGQPKLAHLLPWAAVGFLVAPWGQQFAFLLQRELAFNRIAGIEIAGAAAGLAVSCTTAVLGAGALALIWGALALAVVRTGLLMAVGWRRWAPTGRPRWARVRPHLDFGGYSIGAQVLEYATSNVDYLLIGLVLGPHALGFYALGYQLIIRPLQRLNPIVNRVAFPVYAIKQDDDAALQRGMLEVTRLIAFVTVPVLAGLAVTAPDVVPVVFGGRWVPSVQIVQILAAVGILKALYNPVGPLLLAKNRPDIDFKLNAVITAVLVTAIGSVVALGIVAVAWAYLAVTVAAFVLARIVADRVIGLPSTAYVRAVSRPVAIGIGSAAVAGVAATALDGTVTGAALVATLVAVGAVAQIVLAAVFDGEYLRSLLAMVRRSDGAPRAGGTGTLTEAAA